MFVIVSLIFSLMGLFHISQIVWTRTHKKQILAKYKPGSLAYEASLKFVKTKRLAITIAWSTAAIACFVIGAISAPEKVVVPSIAIGAIAALASMVYSYTFLYKGKN